MLSRIKLRHLFILMLLTIICLLIHDHMNFKKKLTQLATISQGKIDHAKKDFIDYKKKTSDHITSKLKLEEQIETLEMYLRENNDTLLLQISLLNRELHRNNEKLSRLQKEQHQREVMLYKNMANVQFRKDDFELDKKLETNTPVLSERIHSRRFRNEPFETKFPFTSAALCDDNKPGGKNILSYSLFGKKATQYGRFIKNIATEALHLEIHKSFTIRIYVDKHFPVEKQISLQKNYTNIRFCNIKNIPGYGNLNEYIGSIWRFIPLADQTIDIMCARDIDSPLLERESDAMKEWMEGDKIFHVMRDRKEHNSFIMGGMWCFKNINNRVLGKTLAEIILTKAQRYDLITADQYILNKWVWPHVLNDTLQHDAYLCEYFKDSQPFPTQRKEYFVGCVRDCWVYGEAECPHMCRPRLHQDWKFC